jgi:hypothetical protein
MEIKICKADVGAVDRACSGKNIYEKHSQLQTEYASGAG